MLREGEDGVRAEAQQQKKRKLKFLGDEITHSMTDLEAKFTVELKGKTNEEVSRLKNELSQLSKDMQSVAKMIQSIVEAGETENVTQVYEDRYKKLLSSKSSYDRLVHTTFDSRETEKQKAFIFSSWKETLSTIPFRLNKLETFIWFHFSENFAGNILYKL